MPMWVEELPLHSAMMFLDAVHSADTVSGFTHTFYKYPARFSPLFARAAIEIFTSPGDVVFDPFMGGGTTLVEARLAGRYGIGADLNELAVFLAQVKTTLFSTSDLNTVYRWALSLRGLLSLRNRVYESESSKRYQYNLSSKKTWRIRKLISLILGYMYELRVPSQEKIARCALLKTAQWALDSRTKIPSVSEFRKRLIANIIEMSEGAIDFADKLSYHNEAPAITCLKRSSMGIEQENIFKELPPPKLILTSPPYAGVHVLYHRWQVTGRKETPAPYWIANVSDSHGESFYTMGNRKQRELTQYYDHISKSFESLAKIADRNTFLVQMVGFSKPQEQLEKYLTTIEKAGFCEIKFSNLSNSPDGRIWRCVPNRKWYATPERSAASSKEVVLFHRLKCAV